VTDVRPEVRKTAGEVRRPSDCIMLTLNFDELFRIFKLDS